MDDKRKRCGSEQGYALGVVPQEVAANSDADFASSAGRPRGPRGAKLGHDLGVVGLRLVGQRQAAPRSGDALKTAVSGRGQSRRKPRLETETRRTLLERGRSGPEAKNGVSSPM